MYSDLSSNRTQENYSQGYYPQLWSLQRDENAMPLNDETGNDAKVKRELWL